MVDESGKGGSKVVRWDVGSRKGGNGGSCCRVSCTVGWKYVRWVEMMGVCCVVVNVCGVRLYSFSSSLRW